MRADPQCGTAVNQAFSIWSTITPLASASKKTTRGINILELVLTTNPDLIQRTQIREGMSDHDAVITDIDLKIKTTPGKRQGQSLSIRKPT